MRSPLVALILLCSAGLAPADPARDALAEMTKCSEIGDSAERLKCYDAAAPRAKSALALPVPATEAKEKGGLFDWFGFGRPRQAIKAEDFGKPEPPPAPGEVTEINANVLEFARTPRGR